MPLVPAEDELAQPLPPRLVVVIVRVAVVAEPVPGLVVLGAVHEVVSVLVVLHVRAILILICPSPTSDLVQHRR